MLSLDLSASCHMCVYTMLPVPPGPVNNVTYFATIDSINLTWSHPLYTDSVFGKFLLLVC